jgi:hypothetical protein
VAVIREAMFKFFQSEAFLESYFEIGKQASDLIGVPMQKLVMQAMPTPRVFRPGDHGTSFHCDYWYGHGLNSYTIWSPLSDVQDGNTFYVLAENKQEEAYKKIVNSKRFTELEDDLMRWSKPVLPLPGSAYIFDSKVLHGSPKNTTDETRISFDFRLGEYPDNSSTKDLLNYFHFLEGKFVLPQHKLKNKRILKYICGGNNKNTLMQHCIIEEVAKRYGINISEQEAEIERYGYPMLRAYLAGSMTKKNLDGIIIASESILDAEIIAEVLRSDMSVWCALENKFIK